MVHTHSPSVAPRHGAVKAPTQCRQGWHQDRVLLWRQRECMPEATVGNPAGQSERYCLHVSRSPMAG
jgi:hypothetical protein